jgi:hypothetical protein
MASIDWLTVLVSAAINTPAVGALLGWLGKRRLAAETAKHNRALEELRAKYNLELEAYKSDLERAKQMLQAEIEKTILVTKVQFETEFEAFKRVFARLAEIRPRLSGLRPTVSIVPANDTDEAKRKRLFDRIAEVKELYNNLATDSENFSPFYPAEIYAEIAKCRIDGWRRFDARDSLGGFPMFGRQAKRGSSPFCSPSTGGPLLAIFRGVRGCSFSLLLFFLSRIIPSPFTRMR